MEQRAGSIIPPWLELRMSGSANVKSRVTSSSESNRDSRDQLENSVSKLFGSGKGHVRDMTEIDNQKIALTLFGVAPHKRIEEDIRIGAMWLRGTNLAPLPTAG